MFKTVIGTTFLLLALPAMAITTANDGDWSAKRVTLANTPEAQLMVRVGDINNLGFGWPGGYDPFSGTPAPQHGFPWKTDIREPDGTDRIMVVSSYNGHPPHGSDGYTRNTRRPDNSVQSIILNYDPGVIPPLQAATLQMFVDDFQAPVWGTQYQVKFNGQRIAELENIINSLKQTGPIGELITFKIPANYLGLLSGGRLEINIDDPSTGAGDGYAIDFVKLLLNPGVVALPPAAEPASVTISIINVQLPPAKEKPHSEDLCREEEPGVRQRECRAMEEMERDIKNMKN